MNIADILRRVADALAAAEQQQAEPEQPAVVAAVPPAETGSCGCGGATDDEAGSPADLAPQDEPAAPEGDDAAWMPPQTQEMELMKKMAGEPNEFDGGEGEDGDMDRLKKLAGITAIKR